SLDVTNFSGGASDAFKVSQARSREPSWCRAMGPSPEPPRYGLRVPPVPCETRAASPAYRRQLAVLGTRVNKRPARSTPTTTPWAARVKEPRCPFKPPVVTKDSSLPPGNKPKSNGG